MPTKNPRINVVLDRYIYDVVNKLAKKEGVSLSLKARDLLNEALEIYEDTILDETASEREKTFNRKKALTHDQVWKK